MTDLSEQEAAALGRLRTELARALKDELKVEFVFAAVIGTGVEHFHEHLLPRPKREPREVEWHRSDELLERGDEAAVRHLAALIKARIS
jgi:diadenosine tetraphosphate (Ap4A) HIT family hydrolase